MKKKLMILIGSLLICSVSVFGQTSDIVTDKEAEEMWQESKKLVLESHKLSQAPFSELTETIDVRQEAQKYFEAWIKGDADTILAYTPPFKIKDEMDAAKMLEPVYGENLKDKISLENMKPIDLIKLKLQITGKDTFQYLSVNIGDITETGILPDEYHKEASVFTVLNFRADVYVKGKKDVMNANVVGYTDGKRWYFQERGGLTENLLREFQKDEKTQETSKHNQDDDLEKQIREDFKKAQYVYIAKVTNQRRVRSGTFRGRHNETVIDYSISNRMITEKTFKGIKRKRFNLETNAFTKGTAYLIFADSYNSYSKAVELEKAEKELKIIEKILAGR